MAVVVDSSISMKWLFEDEATPATAKLLDSLRDDSLVVPSLWLHEVASVLLVAERRGRISANDADEFVRMLRTLSLEIDYPGFDRAIRVSSQLARDHALTPYDAAYLELAQRMQLPLATLDVALVKAAKVLGIEVLPPSLNS